MNAVEQAVALLREGLKDITRQIDDLRIEKQRIEQALSSLSASPVDVVHREPLAASDVVTAVLTPGAPTITAAVRAVLESKRGPWTPVLVREALASSEVQGDRSKEQFIIAIRTAMHTLRKSGAAGVVGNNLTVARKWLTDAEAPAGTGASEKEEPNSGSSRQEGESRVETTDLPRGGDHDPD